MLITDGYDEDSVTPIDEVLAAVKAAQVTVYVIGIGGVAGVSRRGERMLRRLASETGGQMFLPRDEALVAVHERLAADVQNRYLVTYTPTNQTKDGTWRHVSLTTGSDYVVRTRTGYIAPKPPPIRPELEFTISDRNRRYQDLSAQDLTVVEDGVEQKIDAFHEVVAPVSIVLALDSSGSMRKSVSEAIDAARGFVAALRPEDSLGLVLFADHVTFAHDLTKTARGDAQDDRQLHGDRWHCALRRALGLADAAERVEGRRAIVVVTDGRDENNPGTAPAACRRRQEVLDLTRQVDTTIFTIGLGPESIVRFSKSSRFAREANRIFPVSVDGLHDDYRRVVENLRRRFVVSYTSTNGDRNGSWRDVEIRPRSSGSLCRVAAVSSRQSGEGTHRLKPQVLL